MGEVSVFSARQRQMFAVMIGVMVAVVAVAAFSYWLHGLMDSRGREEVALSAQRALRLAELRIGSALATLDDLAARGVNDCSGSQVSELRAAAFFNPAIKEVAIVAADGRMICGSSGLLAELRTVVTPARGEKPGEATIDVVQVGGRQSMVRIVRHGDASASLAALIPTQLFSTSATQQVIGRSTYVRVATRDDMTIVERGPAPVPGADPFRLKLHSDQYGLNASASLPRSALDAEADVVKRQATVLAATVFGIILVLAWLMRSRRDDPYGEFRQAIEEQQFVAYYQPIVDIRTGRLRGAEVLMRWRKPDGSVVLPSAFIPLAESSGLIVPLTCAIMRSVCEEVGEVIGRRPDVRIGFNLAAPHFADDRIISDVRGIFEGSPIPLRQVTLEVTERQPLQNLASARRIVAGLQELGCSVAIDDVGTGHGGLSYILKLGADVLKIDKLFIDAIGTEHDPTTILETLVDLARSMRMGVVAEGVETFEQVVKLRELGILAAQGYVFCPPLPGPSFIQLVEAISPLPQGDDRLRDPGDLGIAGLRSIAS